MRIYELLTESANGVYTLFHGSPYGDIEAFRTDGLRNRTGTPGTLSFTTRIETARIYGPHVYEVRVQGTFGDYLDSNDVERALAWRLKRERASLEDAVVWWAANGATGGRHRPSKLDDLDAALASYEVATRPQIEAGYYAQWENKGLWAAYGWDGAWCHESGSRNLIIGDAKCVTLVGRIEE